MCSFFAFSPVPLFLEEEALGADWAVAHDTVAVEVLIVGASILIARRMLFPSFPWILIVYVSFLDAAAEVIILPCFLHNDEGVAEFARVALIADVDAVFLAAAEMRLSHFVEFSLARVAWDFAILQPGPFTFFSFFALI